MRIRQASSLILLLLLASVTHASREFDNAQNQYFGNETIFTASDDTSTMVAWFKLDEAVSSQKYTIFQLGRDNAYHNYALYVQDQKLYFHYYTSGNQDYSVSTTVTLNEWHFASAQNDGANGSKLKLDGIDPNTNATTTNDGSPTYLRIGCWDDAGSPTDFWSDELAYLAYYDVNVPDAQITSMLTSAPKTVRSSDLMCYYPLNVDEVNAVDYEDTGTDYDLTPYGGTIAYSSGDPYDTGPTAVNYYVNTDVSGGNEDGTSLANAWPDLKKALTWIADGNDPITRNEAITIICRGSTADSNTPIAPGEIESDDDNYLVIQGDKTGTSWDATKYRIVDANCMLLALDVNDVNLVNLQFQHTGENAVGQGCVKITTPGSPTSNRVQFQNCIFRGDDTDSYDDTVITATDPTTDLVLTSCAVYDVNGGIDLLAECNSVTVDGRRVTGPLTELLTNGDFATGDFTGWGETGAGWSVSSNAALGTADGSSSYLLGQGLTVTDGQVYRISYEVTANTLTGYTGLYLSSGGAFGSQTLSGSVGTHTYYYNCTNASATYDLRFVLHITSTGGSITVDNISVTHIGERDALNNLIDLPDTISNTGTYSIFGGIVR